MKLDEKKTQWYLNHPLIKRLSDMAEELAGVRFLVVAPIEAGWDQHFFGTDESKPLFCRMIQEREDGAKQCRMCHIIMSIAAHDASTAEQRCHAGAASLSGPLSDVPGAPLAVLTTCMFSAAAGDGGWSELRRVADKMGLDFEELRREYEKLPHLTEKQRQYVRMLMGILREAVAEITAHRHETEKLYTITDELKHEGVVERAVARQLQTALTALDRGDDPEADPSSSYPAIVDVITDLVSRWPNMPYSVANIASAARVSPNHFSMVFRKHKGVCFSDFLTARRIDLAKRLLRDLTLNITEVARRVGYDDPGYFTRRFKMATGLSPREWRNSLEGPIQGG